VLTPVLAPPPTPIPTPTPPKVDSPPQSSGSKKVTFTWGSELQEEEEKKEEKPPAPGNIRLSWSPPPPQTEAGGVGASLKKSRLNRALHKLPFLRKKDPSKPDTRLKLRGRSKK
jgi:hypothetical protein